MKKILVILFVVVVVPVLVVRFVWPLLPGDKVTDGTAGRPPSGVRQPIQTTPDQIVSTMVQSEQLLRAIDPALSSLSRAVLNLRLPDGESAGLFDDQCVVREISEMTLVPGSNSSISKFKVATKIIADTAQPGRTLEVWRSLLEQFDYFDQAKFYAIKVSERTELPHSFVTATGFDAMGKTKRGAWVAIHAGGRLRWQQRSENDWTIAEWDFDSFELEETPQRLFDDVSAACFTAADRTTVQRSRHYEMLTDLLSEKENVFADQRQQKYFPHIATGRHPSLSVVDIDRDGWDDLYVVEQWRDNMLFRNRGDGTFEEQAAKYQLDVAGYGTSALFADFDNDGDDDLFLGRSLRRSRYLENVEGRFVDRSAAKFSFNLPYLVSSLSASDYNGDGLLDIYVSTYGFLTPGLRPAEWIREFLDEGERREVMRRFRAPEFNRYLNAAGPRNLLLENRGDHFEISPFNDQVALYSNTLQSTWADYDADGDPDLYVANDFARDFLLRNDRELGFADVTFEIGDDTMMGFGMGASWGDYDLDGHQDLYVSNMYSKAGLRIVEQFGQLDKRFRRSADGNRLYRNTGEKLALASANEGSGLNVHKAGWSWGGQFLDFNNDGYLDIYVTSGYFTAPAKFASTKDL